MFCAIYKGRRKADTYLYLPVKDDFSSVPPEVLSAFGEPIHVMDLVLTPRKRLAQVDVRNVMRALLLRGCYVQLPPRHDQAPQASPGLH